jgi:hypothetical protein
VWWVWWVYWVRDVTRETWLAIVRTTSTCWKKVVKWGEFNSWSRVGNTRSAFWVVCGKERRKERNGEK